MRVFCILISVKVQPIEHSRSPYHHGTTGGKHVLMFRVIWVPCLNSGSLRPRSLLKSMGNLLFAESLVSIAGVTHSNLVVQFFYYTLL